MTNAQPRIFRVKSPFVLHVEHGAREHYLVGADVFSEDHHAVKANPDGFVEVVVLGAPPVPKVEQASAAPGERRPARKPAK